MDAPPPPFERMFEIVTNYWTSRAVYAGTVLGLPDLVAEGPKTVAELAELTGSDPLSLGRLLRALSGAGLFQADAQGRYASTDLGDTLRADVPGSLASFVQMELGEAHHRAWGEIVHAVQSGRPAFDKAVGKNIWEFFETTPAMAAHLGKAMSGLTAMVTQAVAEVYDFGPYRKIVDVGGGEGAFLSAILTAHPAGRGVVFDLPPTVDKGRPLVAEAGLGDRCELVGGDFFESVPAGGDLYTMKWVLHDWDDKSCIDILTNVRKAMRDDARLLIVETVVPEGDDFSPSKIIDLNMMVLTIGRERTAQEFRALLSAAGFTVTRILPTLSPSSVIEAAPAPLAL